jgi:Zn-dependent protease
MHVRLLGFPISLHDSWPVAFCLLTWALSTAIFQDALPGVPMRAHWAAGAVATLFILASVLFHEIAHAVAARRYQYRIKRIYLHILGGWTGFDRDLQTPTIEARVAAAGPAFSFGLAGILWYFSVDSIVRELDKVNMMLDAYNLLSPACRWMEDASSTRFSGRAEDLTRWPRNKRRDSVNRSAME